jgi:hypothetical protein
MSEATTAGVTHHRCTDMPAEPLQGGITRRLITGERVMIAHDNERERIVRVPEDTLDVDIFNPPRQDRLAGTDAYLSA